MNNACMLSEKSASTDKRQTQNVRFASIFVRCCCCRCCWIIYVYASNGLFHLIISYILDVPKLFVNVPLLVPHNITGCENRDEHTQIQQQIQETRKWDRDEAQTQQKLYFLNNLWFDIIPIVVVSVCIWAGCRVFFHSYSVCVCLCLCTTMKAKFDKFT